MNTDAFRMASHKIVVQATAIWPNIGGEEGGGGGGELFPFNVLSLM